MSISNFLPFLEEAGQKLNHALSALGNSELPIARGHGLLRCIDEHILVATLQLLKTAEHPLRILSLGAGVTWNSDERFGRPFLEEYMKSMWGERVKITCCDIRGTQSDFIAFCNHRSSAHVTCLGPIKLLAEENVDQFSGPVKVIDKKELLNLAEFAGRGDATATTVNVQALPSDGRFTVRPALDPYVEQTIFDVQALPGVNYFTDVKKKLLPLYNDQRPDLIMLRHGWPRLERELPLLIHALEPIVGPSTTALIGVHNEIHRYVPQGRTLLPVRAESVFAKQRISLGL